MATSTVKKLEFLWEGKDAQGQKIKGRMEGQNADLIKAQLRRKGITPLKVRKQSAALFASSGGKIKSGDIAIFARQLATMMGAGVPLVQAFDIIGQGHENKHMRELLLSVKTDIESGTNLGQSLAKYPDHFDDMFCNLVAAGEQSGTLDRLLDKIATYKEKTEAIKAKIKKAMMYPAAVIIVAFIVTSILLIFVVPQFEALFSSVGGDLPAFTKLVVNISEVMQDYWYIIFGALIGGGFFLAHLKKSSKKFADLLDRMSLKLPIVGEILHKAATARFARTLSTMSAAGVPLVEAMDSVARASGNVVFYNAIMQMKDEAASGQRLQTSMQRCGLFPNMVVQMVAIGEESGSLDDMLSKVADFFEEEVDNAVDGLTSLLEPLIMAFLGVVIGGLVIAMYLPIFKMGEAFS
ncbi:MAG: type II secretion system F family protein [Gammaproteobacteria bacterium]|nr:type II secretion system F family protein [Gammaproteobacteria bacterium]